MQPALFSVLPLCLCASVVQFQKGWCAMKRTQKTVAAAVILAATGASAVLGCRALVSRQQPAAQGQMALASAAGGVEAVKAHTTVAQELVERAMPNSNPVGQAQLSAAGLEHQAVLSSADKTAASLEELKRELAAAGERLADAQRQFGQEQQSRRTLESQWYGVWGIRAEKTFWTVATVWLIGSVASMAMGLGSPVAWIGKLKGMFAAWRMA